MRNQQSPPAHLFYCQICRQILVRPITLYCGHTFCRFCLKQSTQSSKNTNPTSSPQKTHQKNTVSLDVRTSLYSNSNAQQTNNCEIVHKKINKIPICVICESIIWRPVDEMSQNITINSLIQKYYYHQIQKRIDQNPQISKNTRQNSIQSSGQQFRNKILIKINQPIKQIPMPFCYSEVIFSTYFIQEINEQTNSIIIVWDEIEAMGLGLLGAIKKVDPLTINSQFSKIVLANSDNLQIHEQKYKALFLGETFVRIKQIGIVPINIKNRYIIVREKDIGKIVADLEICDCQIYHAQNSKNLEIDNTFINFFSYYDQMNNHHYIKEIKKLINTAPFDTRNNPQQMIYCVLRILRIDPQKRKQLVLSFDEEKRKKYINNFIEQKKFETLDKMMHVTIPGNSSPTFVLVIILILLGINIFQDYFLVSYVKNSI